MRAMKHPLPIPLRHFLTCFAVKFNRQERTDRNWRLVNIDFFVTVALSPQPPHELTGKTPSACTGGSTRFHFPGTTCPETGQLRRIMRCNPVCETLRTPARHRVRARLPIPPGLQAVPAGSSGANSPLRAGDRISDRPVIDRPPGKRALIDADRAGEERARRREMRQPHDESGHRIEDKERQDDNPRYARTQPEIDHGKVIRWSSCRIQDARGERSQGFGGLSCAVNWRRLAGPCAWTSRI